jgi:hypothetical protein
MTDRIQIISKEIEGQRFTGLRLYLELPATVNGQQYQGPFMHHPGDDDSSAVTFWGKRDLRVVLRKMMDELDQHYGYSATKPVEVTEDKRFAAFDAAVSIYDELKLRNGGTHKSALLAACRRYLQVCGDTGEVKILREIARTFLTEYEEHEEAEWSPEWRALAERCRAALHEEIGK